MKLSVMSALIQSFNCHMCASHVKLCSEKVLNGMEDWVRWCCKEP